MSDVRIVMTGHGRGEVFVDGRRIERVSAVSFEADATAPRRANTVRLTMLPSSVQIEGPAVVRAEDDSPTLRQRVRGWLLVVKAWVLR